MRAIEWFTSSTASKIDMDLIDTENHNQQNQEELKARIKRLEEAGDAVAAIIGPPGSAHWADEDQVDSAWNNWRKAKEAKP